MKQQPEKRNVININKDVYDKLKIHCKDNGLKIVWVVEKLIKKYLK